MIQMNSPVFLVLRQKQTKKRANKCVRTIVAIMRFLILFLCADNTNMWKYTSTRNHANFSIMLCVLYSYNSGVTKYTMNRSLIVSIFFVLCIQLKLCVEVYNPGS